jgi:hypothetical protein
MDSQCVGEIRDGDAKEMRLKFGQIAQMCYANLQFVYIGNCRFDIKIILWQLKAC